MVYFTKISGIHVLVLQNNFTNWISKYIQEVVYGGGGAPPPPYIHTIYIYNKQWVIGEKYDAIWKYTVTTM